MTDINFTTPAAFPPTPYAIGDLQGCSGAFSRLLDLLPQDTPDTPLWLVGDLINRGPDSLATLRHLMQLDSRVTAVLGNHDLHFLAIVAGVRTQRPGDTLNPLLDAPDRDDMVEWLRRRPLAHASGNLLMVHAGVLPQWETATVLELADDIARGLSGPKWKTFLADMYASKPEAWTPNLKGMDRRRVALSALTRIRFCNAAGAMDFKYTGAPTEIPPGYLPWFDQPERKTADTTLVFGHWAAAGLILRDNLCGLDTGCVWGNRLTALPLAAEPAKRIPIQVECPKSALLEVPVNGPKSVS